MLKMSVTQHIDVPARVAKIDNDAFWTFAANEWWRLYFDWVPFDNGHLSQNVQIRPKEIEHTQDYGIYVYNGKGMNFKKDHHPLASAEWDKAAIPTQQSKLIAALQKHVDSGRLNLGR